MGFACSVATNTTCLTFAHEASGDHAIPQVVAEDCGIFLGPRNAGRSKHSNRHRHTGLLGNDFLAIGRAAHGLQYQVTPLLCGCCKACVASSLALFRRCECDLNAFGQGTRGDGHGLEPDVVKTLGIHLLPDLD